MALKTRRSDRVSSRVTTSRTQLILACMLALLAPSLGSARGPSVRECEPGGPPSAIAGAVQIESTRSLQRADQGWLVAAAKSQRPRLFSPAGEAIELPQPPASAETTDWIARGRAVFAVGTAPSQRNGQTNVVLLRWGVDNRPKVTALTTVEKVTAKPAAALAGERLAVAWGQLGSDKRSHVMLSVTDLEELRVQSPVDLGVQRGAVKVAASDSGFIVMWSNEQGVQRALFDAKGKASGANALVAGVGKDVPRTIERCGDQVWVLHDSGKGDVAIAMIDGSGATHDVANLPAPPAGDPMAARCVGDALAVGHRVVSNQGDNVVWISTIAANGKLRQRRVKDMRGTPDSIRSLQLTAEPKGLRAWWLQGDSAATAQLWSREVVCK